MSIASKLEYLDGTKDYIRQCIQQKGVTVPDGTTFRQYGDKILEIEAASEVPPVQSVLQEGVATATGQQFDLLPSEGYDGFSKVAVTGDFNLKPENIAYGITIYGVTGTMEFKPTVAGNIPTSYQSYFDKARELYTGDYKNLMILESDQAVAFGFMLDGFNIETYDETNSEFTASKWVYVAYNKAKDSWKMEDWSNDISNGGSYIKNIRYSDTYIYYQPGTQNERLLYPFLVGPEPPEQLPQSFSFVVNIQYSDLNLSISYIGDGTVDWGDGTVDELAKVVGKKKISHTYAVTGEYTITFNGVFSGIVGGTDSKSLNKFISRINTKLPTTIKDVSYFAWSSTIIELQDGMFSDCVFLKNVYSAFSGCKSLTSIPENLFYGCGSLTNLDRLFMDCSSLREIPSALLMPLDSLISAVELFTNCKSLEKIPVNLFANSRLLKNLKRAFLGCTYVTDIPTGLFDHCQSLEDLTGCFDGVRITSIPPTLFDNCPNIKVVFGCFNEVRITSIPGGLFKNCQKITDFDSCFSYIGTLIEIPSDLFYGIPKDAPLNLESMFQNCHKLTSIPPTLLDGFINVQNISSMFENCDGITDALPEWWNDARFESVPHAKCFSYCTNASNYADVPAGWK